MILVRWGSQLGPIALGLALGALMTSYGPTKLQRIKAPKLVCFRRWEDKLFSACVMSRLVSSPVEARGAHMCFVYLRYVRINQSLLPEVRPFVVLLSTDDQANESSLSHSVLGLLFHFGLRRFFTVFLRSLSTLQSGRDLPDKLITSGTTWHLFIVEVYLDEEIGLEGGFETL
jgi:hypothetical protein